MKHLSKDLFSGEDTSDEEFDELVSELLYVEPPTSLVHNILSSVANISLPRITIEPDISTEDGLVVQHNSLQPS
ncbi:MAG TPA: hypothetical protein VHZ51_12260 [Ktedonobacteraceae bacterium]|jgi:hypothetical protein|nr:hypothetical protein [Ktedonobacteraceae bacterium]